MEEIRLKNRKVKGLLDLIKSLPTYNVFTDYDNSINNLPSVTALIEHLTQLKDLNDDLESIDDHKLKEIAKLISNKNLSKDDTDYLELVLDTLTTHESALVYFNKRSLNLQLTQLRLNWNDQFNNYKNLLNEVKFMGDDFNINDVLSISIRVLQLSSKNVDEMIELNKVPDRLLDDQDKLENDLNNLIQLSNIFILFTHQLRLDSWLNFKFNNHQYLNLNEFIDFMENLDNFNEFKLRLRSLLFNLESIRSQSNDMVNLRKLYFKSLNDVPNIEIFENFKHTVINIKFLDLNEIELFEEINDQVKIDIDNYINTLKFNLDCYNDLNQIFKKLNYLIDDSNVLMPLPTDEQHEKYLNDFNNLQINNNQFYIKLKNETNELLNENLKLLITHKNLIDDCDRIISQLLNLIDEGKTDDELKYNLKNLINEIKESNDKRVINHVNRIENTFNEINEMFNDSQQLIFENDSIATTRRSFRFRSSSVESSSSTLSTFSLIDYNKPYNRSRASSNLSDNSNKSSNRKVFEFKPENDIPPVPPMPTNLKVKNWSQNSLNLPGPLPKLNKSNRQSKPSSSQLSRTPVRKHSLTKATLSSISRRNNRAVSTPTPSSKSNTKNNSHNEKRVLSTSNSTNSLRPQLSTPSKNTVKKKLSFPDKLPKSPKRRYSNLYQPNPKSKLDLAVGKVLNSLPVAVNVERASGTLYDSGKYWIGAPDPKLCFCRILRSNMVMVRVGGGWEELSKFLLNHFSHLFIDDHDISNDLSSKLLLTPVKNNPSIMTYTSPYHSPTPTPSPFMSPYKP